MRMGNPGYDFVCSRGYKIDVKSSTLHDERWQFDIKQNKIADFFLCMAFDTREDLKPMHLWLIPGNTVNSQKYITTGKNSVKKWSQWERPLDDVSACCNKLKDGGQ